MVGIRWRRGAGYRRTVVVGAVSVVLLVLGLRPAAGSPSAAATPTAAAEFSNGQAKATAVVNKIAPGVGNLELALGSGVAVSELKNDLAQSQAQALDLGLIGTTLTSEGCSDAALTPDQLPQPVRVDNRAGDAAASEDYAPVAGETLGGGRGAVTATEKPSAVAVATAAASNGPAVSIGGGKATAVTEVVDGAARQAHATVEADVTIAGIVQLSNLRWDALHRTGKAPKAEATFDIGTAKLAGVPIPLESLQAAEGVINTALAETGITITMPRVERFKEPTDLVRITPLLISLRDSNAGKTALGPGLNASRAQREQMYTDLSAAICEAAGLLLVGDIGLSVASGTGFVTFGIGGAEAISGDFVLENPFGAAVAPPSQSVIPPASGVAPGVATPPAPAPGPTTAPKTNGQPIADVGPLEELCETVHPFDWPDCSEGAMAPLGLLGLFATTGVAALDWRHQRRRLAAPAAPTAPAGAA